VIESEPIAPMTAETQEKQPKTYEDDAITHHLGEAAKVLLVGGAVVAAVVGLWQGAYYLRNWEKIQEAEAVKKHWYDLAEKAANLSDEGKLWMQRTIFNRELVDTKSTDRSEWLPGIPEKHRYCISFELQAMLEGGLRGIGDMKYHHRKPVFQEAAQNFGEFMALVAGSIGIASIPFVYQAMHHKQIHPESILTNNDSSVDHQGILAQKAQKKLGE
jgi:hypothetical protein